MKSPLVVAAIGLSVAVLACGSTPISPDQPLGSNTDTLTWEFINAINSSIDLRFFDLTYGATYPSTTTYWSLNPGDDKVFHLNCNKGANVCFGASVHSDQTLYWGLSVYGNENSGSQGACHVCDGSTVTTISLTSH